MCEGLVNKKELGVQGELGPLDRFSKVRARDWFLGAGFPKNGLGLESPATMKCIRTFE